MADIKINDPEVGQFTMPWTDTTRPPTTDEINQYINTNVRWNPNRIKTTKQNETLWEKANKPVLPELKNNFPPTAEEDLYREQNPIKSFISDAGMNTMQNAYDQLIRPASSPIGIATTGATALAGVPEARPYVLPIARGLLGVQATRGATEAPNAVRQAIKDPNATTIANATNAVASPFLMGTAAVKLGGLKAGETKVNAPEVGSVPKQFGLREVNGKYDVINETTGEKLGTFNTADEAQKSIDQQRQTSGTRVNLQHVPTVQPNNTFATKSNEVVPLPEGLKVTLKPGFENVLQADPKTNRVLIVDMDSFKHGVEKVRGEPAAIQKLSKEVQRTTPSSNYNAGYNPDAAVAPYVSGPRDVSASFADWVNQRAAAKWTGENARNAWSGLDSKYQVPPEFQEESPVNPEEEVQAHPLVQLQSALKGGEEPELERYFNQLHEEARRAGTTDRQLSLGYKEDYLPQMWQNSPEEVNNAFKDTRRLGIKPSFSMQAVFDDYEEGIRRGLTPKFEKPSDLIASYSSYVDKFVADKNFFDQLKENGIISTKKLPDYEALDSGRTPIQRFTVEDNDKTINVSRNYYVPKQYAKVINEYLQGDINEDGALSTIKKVGSNIKSAVMTSGIPGTALNIHGINVGVGRMWQAGGANLVGRYLKMALNPNAATEWTRSNMGDMPRFVRAGMKINPEFEPRAVSDNASLMDKALTAKHNLMERPVFGQVIPALQLELAQMAEKGYLERNVQPEIATRLAAHDANNFVSNLNYDELMRNKQTRNLVSAISFAPQWLESHYNIAKASADALLNPKDPKGYLYRQATGQLVKAYLTIGLINKATSGVFDPFAIHLGKDSKGKEMSLNPLGSGDDWLKMIPQIAMAASEGKPFEKVLNLTKGRLASPAQFVVDALAQQKAQGGDLLRDRKGPLPVVLPEKGRNSQLENLGELSMRTMAPRWIPAGADMLRGEASPLEFGADLAGSQVNFRKAPKVKSPF